MTLISPLPVLLIYAMKQLFTFHNGNEWLKENLICQRKHGIDCLLYSNVEDLYMHMCIYENI
jgi:hypothetical protein